jgi:hypothetical protein
MFDQFSDGYCPECLLADRKVTMILNRSDFWECPECRLRAHTASLNMFALLRERGAGRLKETRATDHVVGFVLTRADAKDYFSADSSGFKSEQELRLFFGVLGNISPLNFLKTHGVQP